MLIDFNNLDFIQDPYPFYAALREQGSIIWDEALQAWMVMSHDAVNAVLLDRELSSHIFFERRVLPHSLTEAQRQRITDYFGFYLFLIDPPRHTELRKVLSPFFARQKVDAHEQRINEILADLLKKAPQKLDFVKDIAQPLVARSIAAFFGFPADRAADYVRWTITITQFLQNILTWPLHCQHFFEALDEMEPFFSSIQSDEMTQPLIDMGVIKDNERWMVLSMLMVLGIETSMSEVSIALYHLLAKPRLYRQLVDEPELIALGVDELIRYDTVAQNTFRKVVHDTTIAGQPFKAGDLLYVFIASANRDPALYSKPDEIQLTRQQVINMSFSTGIHYCMGRLLGRALVQLTIKYLIHHYPKMQLASSKPEWERLNTFRFLKSCPVKLS